MLNKLTRISGIVLVIVGCVWACVSFTVPNHYTRYGKWWTCTLEGMNSYRLFTPGKEKVFRGYKLTVAFDPKDCHPQWYLEVPGCDANFEDKGEHPVTLLFLRDERIQATMTLRLQCISEQRNPDGRTSKFYLLSGYDYAELHRQLLASEVVRLDYSNSSWVVTLTFDADGYHQALQVQRQRCMKDLRRTTGSPVENPATSPDRPK